jgi:hypothetical protein
VLVPPTRKSAVLRWWCARFGVRPSRPSFAMDLRGLHLIDDELSRRSPRDRHLYAMGGAPGEGVAVLVSVMPRKSIRGLPAASRMDGYCAVVSRSAVKDDLFHNVRFSCESSPLVADCCAWRRRGKD